MVFIIGMVGLPAVGKTLLAKKIADKFGFSHINKDSMRDYFIEKIKYFNSAPYSHSNPLIASVNRVVRPSSDLLIKELLEQGQNIIIDGYGKVKKLRENYRTLTKNFNPTIIIVFVKEKEDIILERLRERDKNINHRWVESYHNRWKPAFCEPVKEECDFLIEVSADSIQEAIEKIEMIIKAEKHIPLNDP